MKTYSFYVYSLKPRTSHHLLLWSI